MVKFFDINAGHGDESSDKKSEDKTNETVDNKTAENADEKLADKGEAEALRPDFSVGVPTKSDADENKAETAKPDSADAQLTKDDDKDEDVMPKAPEIPRATPAMAPKEPSNHSPVSAIVSGSQHNKQKIVTAILSIILIVLLGLLVSQAVIYFTQTKKDASSVTPKADTTPKITSTKTDTDGAKTTTPEASKPVVVSTVLTKEKTTIKVLNGGGVAGAGAKAATLLKTAGFTISSTANAKAYTYATTEVLYKNADAKTVADEVVVALKGYTAEAKLDDTVPSSATEIVVIVGKK